jgi:hypothetical protein
LHPAKIMVRKGFKIGRKVVRWLGLVTTPIISRKKSPVTVRVMKTNEELRVYST